MASFDITALEETCITTSLLGKIILIYGLNNTGKTKVASQLFPGRTLLVATEKGYNAIGGIRKVDVDTWSDFRTVVTQLTAKKKKEKARAMYDCVMVDVADRLPNLCNSYTCQSFDPPVDNLADIPYGGGYSALNKEFDNQLNKLALSGYCVVLICHDETKVKGKKPNEYDYIVPKNTFSKAGSVLKDLPDFTIYLESQGVDEEGRAMLSIGHCVQHTEFFARSRFTECPEIISPFTAENLKETVKIACEREAKKLGVRCIDYYEEETKREVEKESKKLTKDELTKMIEPVFRALIQEGYKEAVSGIVERYLGEGGKVSQAEENQVDKLQFIFDKLVDFAEEKDVDWEND